MLSQTDQFAWFQTYFGVDVNAIRDPMRRNATKTMIRTYGQTPKQLFKSLHPNPTKNTKGKVNDTVSTGYKL